MRIKVDNRISQITWECIFVYKCAIYIPQAYLLRLFCILCGNVFYVMVIDLSYSCNMGVFV